MMVEFQWGSDLWLLIKDSWGKCGDTGFYFMALGEIGKEKTRVKGQ